MNPLPVVLTAGVVVLAVGPLRRRALAVASAVIAGVTETASSAAIGTGGVVRAVISGPELPERHG